ncbi:glycerol-3-phosphate acyltransferase [Striga asiatica]|uniref:Glycerol-3-phosphate acyltransferase n=1 Tax=Striga asiatica TaxID=4170 RepID=A0A5A7R021_STRAF|nr:glycerol-3-phosphate acyltransferase [Striga asiatica]
MDVASGRGKRRKGKEIISPPMRLLGNFVCYDPTVWYRRDSYAKDSNSTNFLNYIDPLSELASKHVNRQAKHASSRSKSEPASTSQVDVIEGSPIRTTTLSISVADVFRTTEQDSSASKRPYPNTNCTENWRQKDFFSKLI